MAERKIEEINVNFGTPGCIADAFDGYTGTEKVEYENNTGFKIQTKASKYAPAGGYKLLRIPKSIVEGEIIKAIVSCSVTNSTKVYMTLSVVGSASDYSGTATGISSDKTPHSFNFEIVSTDFQIQNNNIVIGPRLSGFATDYSIYYGNIVLDNFNVKILYEKKEASKIYIGSQQVKQVFVGNQPVKGVYVGTTKVLG